MSQALGVAPFDGAAATYDATFTATRLGRWLRDAVHARLAALFPPGSRVLELGCGTGEDAVWLAQRGVRVVATDASPRMVEMARQKVARDGVAAHVSAHVLRIEDLAGATAVEAARATPASVPVIASEAKQSRAVVIDGLDHHDATLTPRETASSAGAEYRPRTPNRPPRSDSADCVMSRTNFLRPASFDGALSNFGALNCVADLRPVARALARLIRPGGHVALVIMGPWCPWEMLWHGAHGDVATAGRRLRRDGAVARIGGEGVRVFYPSPGQVAAAFAPCFAPVGLRGIGVLLPPTYLDGLVERHPNLFERLARWEARMADTRLAGLFNDHYLIELRRSEMEYQLTN